ncbi:3-hydroxyisobutyrate dehydrogenase [Cadophora sp. DSE1049]|nr:3-hydroxyisobutyrate dehydrogenase [Cadophora sp. DSE1049]
MATQTSEKVAFAGLGAMGFGMASHLLGLGHHVTGFDVYEPSLEKFRALGARTAISPREAAKDNNFFICMVANSNQAESVLFDSENGAVQALPQNATIILCSTVPSNYLTSIQSSLEKLGRKDILLVDSPVSGGTVRAAQGNLTILASGTSASLERGNSILSDMSEKLYIIPGGIGAASNVKMINQLLAGTHIAAAAEAMGLAAKAGLNTRQVYDIIIGAAGNSWMFENRVPHMLDNDLTPYSALDIFVKDMGIVTSSARLQGFPLPLSSVAEQLYLSASAQGFGRQDDSGLVRTFTPGTPTLVHEQAKPQPASGKLTPSVTPLEINKIGFIGLGAMGIGMATSLVKAGFPVCGYDVYSPSTEKFLSQAGDKASAASSPAEAADAAEILILMVQNAAQAEDVLFGSGKVASTLPANAIIILNSTVPPSFAKDLGQRLSALGTGLELIDAPVSGGVVRAASGSLTIISSGAALALSKASPVLTALSGPPSNLHTIPNGAGAASSVKLINQLLAGVHIVAAAEAMAFGARLGLDTRSLYEIIKNAAGGSWMFENRVPAMLNADWTPNSQLAIFVKDLGIVLDEAKRLGYAAPLSAASHQVYLNGAAKGWAKDADSGVVRVWELMTGVSVAEAANAVVEPKAETKAEPETFKPREYEPLPLEETIASLPPITSTNTLATIKERIASPETPALIILDDDPTGTQTCHDIPVLTVWDIPTLTTELTRSPSGFFILTNSRALPGPEATSLIREITANISQAATSANKTFQVVLRGDSTLRGHFPEEPDAVESVLGTSTAWILAPFFYQGGRYTINDVHYVSEGSSLIPASQTPFAKDATFGYKSSNLRDYVLEKTQQRFKLEQIVSVTLDDIRVGGHEKVAQVLAGVKKGSVVVVNAAAEEDMHVFALGCILAEQAGAKFLYRTGAAFVSSRLGIQGKAPMTAKELGVDTSVGSPGGLVIAGSYVPKTTAQLAYLRECRGDKLHVIELDVGALLAEQDEPSSPSQPSKIITHAIQTATSSITSGTDVLLMTSRSLITGHDGLSSLKIGSVVASALVQFLRGIDVAPRYIIAKGGITSSDAATKGLNMRRAMILGQAAPGVPIWGCDEETSRHRGVPYVVFPGNVGGVETLGELVGRWAAAV